MDTLINEINRHINAVRRRRASHKIRLNDAIDLAKNTELPLAQTAETYGIDSPEMLRHCDDVAAEMLNVIIDCINSRNRKLTDTLAETPRVLEYLSQLPVSDAFRQSRLDPQLALINKLLERHHISAPAHQINYQPTVGDDEYYSHCSTYDDLSRYMHRHPNGAHRDEARARMDQIKLGIQKRIRRRRFLASAVMFTLAAALIVAVCYVLNMRGLSIIGALLIGAAVVCAAHWRKVSGAEHDSPSPRRAAIAYAVTTIVLIAAGIASISLESVRCQRNALNKLIASGDEDGLMAYIANPANTHYADKALMQYLLMTDSIFLSTEHSAQGSQMPVLARMQAFANSADLPEKARQAIEQRVLQRSDSIYAAALTENTLDAWRHYQNVAPSELYRDSNERIDSIEAEYWSTESTAWILASKGNRETIQQYLDIYPTGAHVNAANARLIDLEVNDYRNKGNGIVESIDHIADYPGKRSKVCIFNDSEYDVTFLFSGPTSRRWTVPANGYDEIDIDNGQYQVLAQVDNPAADRFSFSQTLDRGIYSSTIKISSE